MKKILILVLVLVLVLLSSCTNAPKEPVETQTQPQDTETSAPSEFRPEDYCAIPIPHKAYSIDDLVTEIKDVKNGKYTDSGLDVSSLNELIVPDVEIEGYKLWIAEVNEYNFEYVYIPTSSKIEKNMQIDYDNHIVIYIARPEFVPNKDNPLQGIVGQMGVPINEDGYVHISHMRDIAFAYEQTWASVRYPTALTYDEAKQYCKLKTVKID